MKVVFFVILFRTDIGKEHLRFHLWSIGEEQVNKMNSSPSLACLPRLARARVFCALVCLAEIRDLNISTMHGQKKRLVVAV